MMPGRGVVKLQKVFAEVVGRIAPYAVDVVGLVLNAVVFDQEGWPHDPVVSPGIRVSSASPKKRHLVKAGEMDPAEFGVRDLRPMPARVFLDQTQQQATLLNGQVARRYASSEGPHGNPIYRPRAKCHNVGWRGR